MNIITIDGIEFDAANRAIWSAVNLVGWKSSPPMRAQAEDRPNGDGAFGSSKNYRSARVLGFEAVLDGGVLELDYEDRWAALQADGTPITISVEDGKGLRSVTGTLQGVAEVEPDPDHLGSTLRGTFLCYDPIKYGPAVTVSTGLPSAAGGLEYPLGTPSGALYYGANGTLGRVTLTNGGTAEVWPSVVVSGYLDSGFEVRCVGTGDVVRYDRVVPAGTTVSIDFRTGAVLIDGVSDASTYLTMDSFFPVPADGSCEVQFSAIGVGDSNAAMTVTYQPGWW